jgi:putative ATP-dependent endonuclease of OLD family
MLRKSETSCSRRDVLWFPTSVRLERFSIQKYRSIIAAEKLELGNLTVLVGPNNEGKSNILQALVVGMEELSSPRSRPQRAYRRRGGRHMDDYVWQRDFPQALQDKGGKSVMDFDFRLSEEEIEEFQREVGNRLNGALPLRIEFGTERAVFSVRKQRHSKALSAKRVEIAQFMAKRVRVRYVPAVRDARVSSDIVRELVLTAVTSTRQDPEYEEALAKIRKIQQPVLDSLADAIRTRLHQLVPEVAGVTIEIDEREIPLRDVRVMVDDGTITELELKGDGVQSLTALAVIQHESEQRARGGDVILAVEEPEAHLHPRAVHALRSTLLDAAKTQQVVMTTHSPLLVNRLDVASNIVVEKSRAQPAPSVKSLREVLGVRPSDNLHNAEVTLLVEGTSDARILQAVLADGSARLRQSMEDGVIAFQPLFGSGNLGYALRQVDESLSLVHSFVDADDAGRAAAKAVRDAGLAQPADQTFADLQGATQCELEDLLEPLVYRDALLDSFNVDVTANPWIGRLSRGKWSARMSLIFKGAGQSWDTEIERDVKTVVADSVTSSPSGALKVDARPVIEALSRSLLAKLARSV